MPETRHYVFGVRIANTSREDAIELVERTMLAGAPPHRGIFLANAHTLNLAAERPDYRRALNTAFRVYADGTGARWASRLRGVQLEANMVGTDFVPQLLRAKSGKGYRCFLLGSDERTIEHAAGAFARAHPGWELAGSHHGHLTDPQIPGVLERINSAAPHLLLVGMGNPVQEMWIHDHGPSLAVPVSIAVGGLFDHWAGNLNRAPAWVRSLGFEWTQLMLQQPHKWRRYLLGNPKFLFRMFRELGQDRRLGLPS